MFLQCFHSIFDSFLCHFDSPVSKEEENGSSTGSDEEEESILNIGELRIAMFGYMKINQLLQTAHAAEKGGNRYIAVSNRIEATAR